MGYGKDPTMIRCQQHGTVTVAQMLNTHYDTHSYRIKCLLYILNHSQLSGFLMFLLETFCSLLTGDISSSGPEEYIVSNHRINTCQTT